MNDPTTLGLASTAVGLVNGTIGLLKEARNAAKRSDDHDLKDKLSEVFDAVLELKEVVGNLRDENAALQKQLQTRAALKWDTARKMYFAEDDPDPFCPACLDVKGQQVRLQPVFAVNSRTIFRYDCKACMNHFMVRH
jgi:hypothetical protein